MERQEKVKLTPCYQSTQPPPEEEEEGRAPARDIRGMTSCARPTCVLIHLFSGRRRQGDLQHYIELATVGLELEVTVVSRDV